VNTKRGIVVPASDVTHFYENLEAGRPFAMACNVGEMLAAYDVLLGCAPSPQQIVPGHDPEVTRPELGGVAARLDVAPKA
jgi:hypothetical protein